MGARSDTAAPGSDGAIRGVDRNLTSYGDERFASFLRRAFLASAGYDEDELRRPVIGIGHTCSDYVPCHRQMPELVEAIKRGVLAAGGLPMAFPTMSLGETLLSPTSMLYRNLAAMETEELIRAQPMDAVVLVGGCDKTVPAQLMAAVSADIPAALCVSGPMMTGSWRGERIGACTDCRRLWSDHRAGTLDEAEIGEARQELCPTAGTCMVMGTASTMACVVEALGLMMPGGATPPAAAGARLRHGVATGRQAVALAQAGVGPRSVVTAASLRNAAVVLAAIGGSTNALVHLAALAGRLGIDFTAREIGAAMADVPLLLDCKPSGKGYMEDFDRAGGVPTLLKALEPFLDLAAPSITGKTLGELLADVEPPPAWQSTIRSVEDPVASAGALTVLEGSLAPEGAVIKASAASSHLLQHTGTAVVFDGPDDLAARLDDPALEITPDDVLVLRNVGAVGAGFPEAGAFPYPRRLAEAGIKDMVRISDGRMSGTGFGTIVLHCAPEAAIGGPLALVRDGDLIRLDVPAGTIDLLVDDAELDARRREWRPAPAPLRGWHRLFVENVNGAPLGADLRFLRARVPTSPDPESPS